MPSASDLDAVTVDAFGTLVELEDPRRRLRRALAERGIDRPPESVAAAFQAEAAYYRPRSMRGRDAASLADLRRECVSVFLEQLDARVDPESFVQAFMDAVVFRLADGAEEALDTLARAGFSLACVANWDLSLHDHLDHLGISHRFRTVLSSAEAGAEKPAPDIFRLALAKLGVPASRALHIGDEDVDRDGAEAASLAFAPAPLATLPRRLGLC